jgi:hypothetical protein
MSSTPPSTGYQPSKPSSKAPANDRDSGGMTKRQNQLKKRIPNLLKSKVFYLLDTSSRGFLKRNKKTALQEQKIHKK